MKSIWAIMMIAAAALWGCRGGGADRPEAPEEGNGLSNMNVTGIAEDAQGHIWMSTNRGLNRFNVHGFLHYYQSGDTMSVPNSNTSSVYLDSKRRLWVATINGVARYTAADNFHRVPVHAYSQNSFGFFENADGELFLNLNIYLARYDEDRDVFETVIPNLDPEFSFATKCWLDPSNRLWVANPTMVRCYNSRSLELMDSIKLDGYYGHSLMRRNGELYLVGRSDVLVLDTRRHAFAEAPAELKDFARGGRVDHVGRYGQDGVLVCSDHGMMLYDGVRTLADTDPKFPFEAPGFQVSATFTDSRGNFWIGSADQGYAVRYAEAEYFNRDRFLWQQFENTSVVALASDGSGKLYIGTKRSGIYCYDSGTHRLEKLSVLDRYLGDNMLEALKVDRRGRLWLGGTEDLVRADFSGPAPRIRRFGIGRVRTLAEDYRGQMWVGCRSPRIHIVDRSDSVLTKAYFPITYCDTRVLEPLDGDRMLIGTFNQPLTVVDIRTDSVVVSNRQVYTDGIRGLVGSFVPTAGYTDTDGNVWLGTGGNGLFKYLTAADTIVAVPGLSCGDVEGITADAQGNVWVSTLSGLNKYDRTTGDFNHYYKGDGIGGDQFCTATALLPDGTICFGANHGLTTFNTLAIPPHRPVNVLFENIKIHNRLVTPGRGECIDRHLSLNPPVTLRHDDNSFSISFTAMEYSRDERVRYFYMLEGFDRGWIDAGNNREAYYANIPPGEYSFRVRVTNRDNDTVEAENTLSIRVRRSPWCSWWAWLIYSVVASGTAYVIVRHSLRIRAERQRARKVQLEKEQEQRISRMNMSFFSNVSHEFRSPLTLIAGPLSELAASPTIRSERDRGMIAVIRNNVERMLRLVNQMMDFHKLENDTLRLSVARTDVAAAVMAAVGMVEVAAARKGVSVVASGTDSPLEMWLDVDKIEKIMSNLLSNALRVAPRGSRIAVSMDVVPAGRVAARIGGAAGGSAYLQIRVADAGPGIPEEQLENIFRKYYQVEGGGGYNFGTGIGLYYARALARTHHGELYAANRADSQGAVFTLLLPVGDESYAEDARADSTAAQGALSRVSCPEAAALVHGAAGGDKPEAIVIDDDPEIAEYETSLLSPDFSVTVCLSAEEALERRAESAPAVIVCDVKLPGMSGYEFCRTVKTDSRWCHVPVILVTAKTTVDEQVRGLAEGADAYVTKPFEPAYLQALVATTVANRRRLAGLLSQATTVEDVQEPTLSAHDKTFMAELYALMEEMLTDSEFDVVRAVDRLKISRTKLYYKIKGLTGTTPSAFFKTYKLNRAAELLREGRHTVSEIADMTGFSTLSHFSSSFKKHFGKNPSEY